ncbi:uncharacterized protein LOC129909730 [Episyrphus balteatus]|uniref:uncharacterized protein LOC129909730 n=1 Tax=Episyrphus balteatus TaxID=286459 RepID=UPI0024863EDF|nr:uncharacterized protein LOC129909730 [Episyrphus balteatus]
MRDYPSIPNVFRVSGGSTNSVNLIDRETAAANGRSNAIQSLISPGVGGGGDTTITSGRCPPPKKTEKDLSSVGIELNYHNGKSSAEYLLRRSATTGSSSNSNRHVSIAPGSNNFNFVANNSQLRLGGGDGAAGAINSISGAIPPVVANVGGGGGGGFPGGPNAGASVFSEGSDLNISLNSFTDINNIPSCSTTTMAPATAATRHHREKSSTYLDDRVALNRRFSSERNSGYFLWIMTPVAASFSVAIVIAALAGPQWLFTEEKLPNANYNGTANFNAQDDGAFITKYTKSSLWILCTAQQGIETYNCIKIDYFPKEGYQPDPHDSTPAIPYTITKSCPFFLASGVFLLISFIVFLVPTCSHQNNLYYFSSGIMFIVSGLFMLIGLIAYISILKAEIGSKLRPRSTLQPALFKVTYGQSFFLYVFGFISTEFVGVLNVFLYISLQEVGYYSKLPCLSFTNIQEKIREGENRSSKHHPHRRKENLAVAGYNCKKHPSNVFNDLEKRYYFEKPQKCDLHSKNIAKSLNELYTEPAPPHFHHLPPQDIHFQQQQHHHQQQQLQQFQQQQHHPHQQQSDFAPLTRSVSTATEIFSNAANGNAGQHTNMHFQNNNGTEKRGSTITTTTTNNNNNTNTSTNASTTKKHQATLTCKPSRDDRHHDEDNDSIGSDDDADDDGGGTRMRNGSSSCSTTTTGIQDICGLSRGIRKTKDEFFNEFCKKAGVRPKPKDIYFINDHEDDPHHQHHDDENIYIVDCAKPQNSGSGGGGQVPQQHHHHQRQQGGVYYPNLRRNSMFVDLPPSNSLRKQNSNLSLHADSKLYQKSLFDLDRCESEIWNTYPEQFYAKGSTKQLQDCNVYQSRTLPRSFMKRNFDSQESLLMSGGGAATTMMTAGSQGRLSGHNHYPTAIQQQASRLSNVSREATNIYRSGQMLHKSCEDVRNSISQQHGGGVSSRRPSTNLMPSAVQWPSAIPTSPSNFSSNSYLYGNQPPQHQHQQQQHHQQQHPAMAGRATTKFTRTYGFDDRRGDVSTGGGVYDAFDLDEIERERRRSHASLFDGRYDVINGTAV